MLAGLLFATTSQVARGTNLRAEVTDVSQLIRAEDARNAERTARVGELRAEVDALSQDKGGSTRAKEDTARADRLAPAAGYARSPATPCGSPSTTPTSPLTPCPRA